MLDCYNFRFVKATSDELKDEIFRLRYRTYVEEFGFEKPEDHPDGRETDEYDRFAIHFAALNGHGDVVGTIRLILGSEIGFPVEHASNLSDEFKTPAKQTAEISRLTISKKIRKRREDGPYGVRSYLGKSEGGVLPDTGPVDRVLERRKLPAVLLGLCQIMYHESKRLRLTYWYMITEKLVFHTLKKFGFVFRQIGEPVEYHGLRIPFGVEIDEIERNLIRQNPVFMKMLLQGLEEQYHPKFGLAAYMRMVARWNYYSRKAKSSLRGQRV